MTDSPAVNSYLDGVELTFGASRETEIHINLVPEPMSLMMLGCLGAGMVGARRLRRRKKA